MSPDGHEAQPRRFLIVDDAKTSLVLWRSLLGQLFPGATLDTADTAEAAIAKLRQSDYDVLLADHHLPGMSGVDLLALAHDERPHVVRILMTGSPRIEMAMEAIRRGRVHGFVRKDGGPREMTAQLTTILKSPAR